MKEFFPFDKVVENERNFENDARRSLSNFEQMREQSTSKLTYIDTINSKYEHGSNARNTK